MSLLPAQQTFGCIIVTLLITLEGIYDRREDRRPVSFGPMGLRSNRHIVCLKVNRSEALKSLIRNACQQNARMSFHSIYVDNCSLGSSAEGTRRRSVARRTLTRRAPA